MKTVFFIYVALLAIMGTVAFIAYGRDKRLARQNKYRTPERTLLALAACFGGIGAFVCMQVFRHKTRHTRFVILVPLSMVLQLALLGVLAYFGFIA